MANVRNDELRGRIVDTACALFLEKGYAKTTLKKIATECGISQSLLQYYFGKRADLAVAIFYDLILQCHQFIAWEKPSGEGENDDSDLVSMECFYLLFYEILHYDNDRLLKLYTVVLYDAQLLKNGTDLIWENRDIFNWPGRTHKSRLGGYALNGILSQFVSLYLENQFDDDLFAYVTMAVDAFYDFIDLDVDRRKRAHEVAEGFVRKDPARTFVAARLKEKGLIS